MSTTRRLRLLSLPPMHQRSASGQPCTCRRLQPQTRKGCQRPPDPRRLVCQNRPSPRQRLAEEQARPPRALAHSPIPCQADRSGGIGSRSGSGRSTSPLGAYSRMGRRHTYPRWRLCIGKAARPAGRGKRVERVGSARCNCPRSRPLGGTASSIRTACSTPCRERRSSHGHR